MKKWNDQKIKEAIYESMETLVIDRMPTKSELESISRGDLANRITRTLGYYGWADKLCLNIKNSETTNGKRFELVAENELKRRFEKQEVVQMPQNHPFDILFGNLVKVDVKVGRIHDHFGVDAYTFRTSKKYGSCDLYLCYGLNKNSEINHVFIIPASEAQVKTLNVTLGGASKYLEYLDRWDFFEKLVLSSRIALAL